MLAITEKEGKQDILMLALKMSNFEWHITMHSADQKHTHSRTHPSHSLKSKSTTLFAPPAVSSHAALSVQANLPAAVCAISFLDPQRLLQGNSSSIPLSKHTTW